MGQQAPAIGADVTALMGGQPPSVAAPPPIGADVSALMMPDFRSSNARDAAGNPVVLPSPSRVIGQVGAPPEATPAQPGALERFAGAAWSEIDPGSALVTIAKALTPKALGGTGPVDTVKQIGKAQGAVFDRAKRAYERGDNLSAAIHFVNYLLPIVGPSIENATDLLKAGKWAEGAGHSLGIGLALFGPEKLRESIPTAAKTPAGSTLKPPAPVDPVLQFARDRGVPLDAATATGSRTVRALEKRAANSIGGEGTATRSIQEQSAALQRVGGELAADAGPSAVSPASAGQGIRDAITSTIKSLHARANDSYAKLRDIEEGHVSQVPKQVTPTEAKGIKTRQIATLGRVPTEAELQELRSMKLELEEMPFTPRTWEFVKEHEGLSAMPNAVAGGHAEMNPGGAGAPVFQDILDHSPGTSGYTRGEVIKHLDAAIETGQFTNTAKGALEVAAKRMKGSSTVSRRMLRADAPTQEMHLAVDLRDVKSALQPIYERLKREGELAPLMGEKAQALRAIDRVVNGPDHAPLSIADAALSDLKTLARTDGVQELRGAGKGIAAAAVRKLDEAVQMHAAAAGDEALGALQSGRKATRAKYAAGDLLDSLRDEPVKVFRQMTAPRDEGIKLLRQVRDMAPERMADVARAWLQDRLDFATQEAGKFNHSARLYSDWSKLGTETKGILFPKAGQAQMLDHFFALARRLAENPNPSGTAHTLAATNLLFSIGSYPLSKLLYTPGGVRAITRVMSIELPSGGRLAAAAPRTASTAARAAALADLAKVAQSIGVDFPKAADRDDQR